jgi:cytochrome c
MFGGLASFRFKDANMSKTLDSILSGVVSRGCGTAVLLAVACTVNTAYAGSEELTKFMLSNNCTACHMIDKRKYGPQFVEVAEKYAGDSGAASRLAAKIKAGGTGVWGEDVMPPQPHVSDADAKAIAELILALKPAK